MVSSADMIGAQDETSEPSPIQPVFFASRDVLVYLCDLISRTTYPGEKHMEFKKPEFEDDVRIGQRHY